MRRRTWRIRQALLVLLIPCVCWTNVGASAEKADWQKHEDERRLDKAGIAKDGEGLLRFLRSQIPTEKERRRLSALIKRLGHRSYSARREASRELIKAGQPAVALLNEALAAPDLEIAHRARQALTVLEQRENLELISAAARLLADARPDGTVAALLAYLPWTRNDAERDVFLSALIQSGIEAGKPCSTILQAADAEDPNFRAAAAHVLGQVRPLPKELMLKLVHDSDVEVRFRAARALVRAKVKNGIPPLIDLLREVPDDWCWQIEDLLYCLGDLKHEPPDGLAQFDPQARSKAVKAWSLWWGQREKDLDLTKVNFDQPHQGLTLYCEYDGNLGGRVWLADRAGKQLWELTGLSGPNDARLLSHNRVLIAERNANRVTERDRFGKVRWEKQLHESVIAAERMKNGHVLITTWSSVLVVDAKGNELWRFRKSMRYAYEMRNRHVLGVASSGEIIELSPSGKLLDTIRPERHTGGAGYWASVEKLPNGRFLLALGTSQRVVEVDDKGKIHWEATVPNAVFATRLRDGTTLVCDFEGKKIVKLNRAGREVSSTALTGRPFVVRQY